MMAPVFAVSQLIRLIQMWFTLQQKFPPGPEENQPARDVSLI